LSNASSNNKNVGPRIDTKHNRGNCEKHQKKRFACDKQKTQTVWREKRGAERQMPGSQKIKPVSSSRGSSQEVTVKKSK